VSCSTCGALCAGARWSGRRRGSVLCGPRAAAARGARGHRAECPSLMPLLEPDKLPKLRSCRLAAKRRPARSSTVGRHRTGSSGTATPAETAVAVTLMRATAVARPDSADRPADAQPPRVCARRAARPVPVGVPGELCIAGTGLARGTWAAGPDADRFVPDPFEPGGGVPDGRPGPLGAGRRAGVPGPGRPAGQIRGYRVEPGEVESVLAADDRIRQVAVEHGTQRRETPCGVCGCGGRAPTWRRCGRSRRPGAGLHDANARGAGCPAPHAERQDRRRALPAPTGPARSAGRDPDEAWNDWSGRSHDVIGPLLGCRTWTGSRTSSNWAAFVAGPCRSPPGSATVRRGDQPRRLLHKPPLPAGRAGGREQHAPTSVSRGLRLRHDAGTVLHVVQRDAAPGGTVGGVMPGSTRRSRLRLRGPFDLEAMRRACALCCAPPALRVKMYATARPRATSAGQR